MNELTRDELTRRQEMVLDFVRTYAATEGHPPSMREIGHGCGLSSTSSVSYVLGRLARRGLLRHTPNRPRSIVLLDVAQ